MSGGRTHYAAELGVEQQGQTVRVAGWVHHRRDHGGLVFIDLRDRSGLVQIVAEPGTPGFDVLERVRAEYVLEVTGTVHLRPEGMVNPERAGSSSRATSPPGR